ncbi:hypothetical protein IEQ34_002811 [Dendrobium chrysotoxum]|uniref:Uncharacterized protein n=1 Tax=Dendrobium chrysotoxum TaxID=161865 RepID=A0AAV7HK08_DENCH|nr:hypothetical protein IEQ34_002811 [Dendrobium chrysotoxum]
MIAGGGALNANDCATGNHWPLMRGVHAGLEVIGGFEESSRVKIHWVVGPVAWTILALPKFEWSRVGEGGSHGGVFQSGQLQVNEKVEVCSFGVALLQLATGTAALDEEIAGGLSEWMKEAEMTFKMDLMCTLCNAAEMQTMKQVVQLWIKLGCGSNCWRP